MPLTLIAGPPNSGRTGAVLERFRTAARRDPLLVVPTLDDVERFEWELAGGAGPVLGASVCTFQRLFTLVARATGVEPRPILSPVQRRRIARAASERADLGLLAASAARPGFASALEELVGELQAAAIDPATLRARAAADAGPYELELASLYARFCEIRDERGRDDAHSLAAAATAGLRARPDAWGGRPVLLYGFDDLSVEQLELVRELWRSCEVTVALPYEDREVLTAARAALFADLRDTDGVTIVRTEANPGNTASATLFELDRRFGDLPDRAAEAEPTENDGGLALLASAGELAEAEAVGAAVAELIHAGLPPGEIAIVLRDPAAGGPLFRSVLARFQVPAAIEADLPIARTLTGAGLVALLQAAVGRRRALDLLAYLRTPGIDAPGRVDWFERTIRRSRSRDADEALELWAERGGRELAEVRRLREAGAGPALLREAARQARWLAEAALRRGGAVAAEDRALELRAGAETERALSELADLGLPHSPGDLIGAIAELRVPMWRGPTEGRVRVISPYRARARRVRHLFIASLQDGDFPRRDTGGPLLSDESRAALALPPRKEAEVEDRYLFWACLSRPTERLWLSWRSADDEGGATARSPFVDAARDLLSPALPDDPEARDQALVAEAGGRGISDSVFSPSSAPTEAELGRAAAVRASGAGPGLEVPGIEPAARDRLETRLAEAIATIAHERLRPGPLRLERVIEHLRRRQLFGPSTLEEYALCPYRWFVNHELDPQGIEPEDEAPTAGQIAHDVLEKVYRERPGGERRPTQATLDQWRERARALVAELGQRRLPRSRADTGAALRRVEGLVLAFIADEARSPVPFLPDPELAEASFGFEDSDKPPLLLAGGAVHGRIDRIDIGPGGEALVQDYKSGAKVDGGPRMLERGKLQLQLYLLAARELWGLELAGGLYRPLGGASDRHPRGVIRDQAGEELAALDPRPGDHLDDEAFEGVLDEARARGEEIVAAIHDGKVIRDPLGGSCPRWCRFQPICRRERGVPEEEPESGEEDEG